MQPNSRSEPPPKPLGRRLLVGGLWVGVGQVSKALLELVTNLVLARLIAPAEFGEVAMLTSVMTLGHLVQDGGLSAATVQAPVLDRRALDTAFWLQLALGCALGLGFAAASPLIAAFYEVPRLTTLGWALSLVFPIQALTAQPLALLARELRMDRLLGVEVVAILVASSVGVAGAVLGWGGFALVARSLARPAAIAIVLLVLGHFRVGLRMSLVESRGLLRFGRDISLYNLVNYLARNLDDVLIGRFYGGTALGLYQRAYQLATAPIAQVNTPVGRLATPVLSRLATEPESYRGTYLGLLAVTLGLTMPLGGAMAAAAEPLVRVLLGERWLGAVPLFTALSLLLFTQPIGHSTGWLFVSQGRSADMLRWGLIGSSASLVSFLIGLPFGPLGVAWSYALGSLAVRLPLLLWYVGRRGPVRAAHVLRVAAPLCAVGGLTFVLTRAALRASDGAGPPGQCLVAAGCALLGVLLGALLTPEVRRTLRGALLATRQELPT